MSTIHKYLKVSLQLLVKLSVCDIWSLLHHWKTAVKYGSCVWLFMQSTVCPMHIFTHFEPTCTCKGLCIIREKFTRAVYHFSSTFALITSFHKPQLQNMPHPGWVDLERFVTQFKSWQRTICVLYTHICIGNVNLPVFCSIFTQKPLIIRFTVLQHNNKSNN